MFTCRRMKVDRYSSPGIKTNYKLIRYTNVEPERLKLLEENR